MTASDTRAKDSFEWFDESIRFQTSVFISVEDSALFNDLTGHKIPVDAEDISLLKQLWESHSSLNDIHQKNIYLNGFTFNSGAAKRYLWAHSDEKNQICRNCVLLRTRCFS